jgi:hypothetical protein
MSRKALREDQEKPAISGCACTATDLSCFLPFALFLKPLLSVAGLWKHHLCRRLYQIASLRTITKARAEKYRTILIDLAIGHGIPLCRSLLVRPFTALLLILILTYLV